jgi:hypothetical protein
VGATFLVAGDMIGPGDWLASAAALPAAGFCLFAMSAASERDLTYAGALVALTIPLYALMRSGAPSVSRTGAEARGGALGG